MRLGQGLYRIFAARSGFKNIIHEIFCYFFMGVLKGSAKSSNSIVIVGYENHNSSLCLQKLACIGLLIMWFYASVSVVL